MVTSECSNSINLAEGRFRRGGSRAAHPRKLRRSYSAGATQRRVWARGAPPCPPIRSPRAWPGNAIFTAVVARNRPVELMSSQP